VKRSVLARFNTDVGFIAGQAVARQKAMEENGDDGEDMEVDAAGAAKLDAMANLERQARAPVGFVAASAGPEGGNRKVQGDEAAPAVRNEEEIDIDEDL